MHLTCLLLALIVAMPAMAQDGELAGPIWGEGPEDNGAGGTKDAGASSETAQQVSSPLAAASGSTLTRITGRTSSGLLQADLVDLYEISIVDPAAFIATTKDSGFDTVLFLFRKVIGSGGVAEARAVAMNDNATAIENYSKLVGSSIPGLTAGAYYIAVAKSGGVPIGFKSPDNDPLLMFTYTPGSTGIVLPTGTQATYTLVDWTNLGNGGDYRINLTGAVVSRSSVCESAIVLGAGTYAFGNAGTSDNNAALRIGLGATCGDDLAWISNPSWFQLGACDGPVQISVCPSVTTATYQMVVFAGSCGDLEPVACGTLGACGGGTGSTVTLTPDPCTTYYVAFGARRESGASPSSAGTLTITCTPDGPSCGVAGSGSCFTARATPTCDSISCCSAVCAFDAFCCNTRWDALCVEEAYATCAPPPACPPNNPDLDGNGVIDGGDLSLLLSQWGT